ncbi:spliceosomal dib1 [Gossypium arboreum]|uniref:Spliceosomal dib1 n=1 Tax=Gossypium arboreum TaxID=29729 RepID=A0A0B0MYH8_GOSAR|nr:spliceosomal dib1 [Gossypium arboreum]
MFRSRTKEIIFGSGENQSCRLVVPFRSSLSEDIDIVFDSCKTLSGIVASICDYIGVFEKSAAKGLYYSGICGKSAAKGHVL